MTDSAARPQATHSHDQTDGSPALRLLFWEATAGCNLACVHCRRLDVSMQLSRDDLTTEQAVSMIRSLPQTGRPILVFSGGEPMMRPDLFELAAEAQRELRRLGVEVKFRKTNLSRQQEAKNE